MKKALAVAKINFKTSRQAYLIFAITEGAILVSLFINMLMGDARGQTVGPGSYAYLLLALFAIFIPAQHFRKFMNLNVKKSAYIAGCAVNYVGMALFASLFNTLCHITVEPLMDKIPRMEFWNLLDIFGWSANGLVISFLQQFAFMLMLAAAAHLLTTIQTFWYGWLADVLIAAVLGVFIPIAPLRGALLWFFGVIIFNPNALLQILACLVLAVVLYALSILPVKNKPV